MSPAEVRLKGVREEGAGTQPWDWTRPFDEDFVSSATLQEDTGQARADRNRRIRSGHQQAGPWRASTIGSGARQLGGARRPSVRRGGRRLRASVVLKAAAVLMILGVALSTGLIDRMLDSSQAVVAADAGQRPPPIPLDAAGSRLLELPAAVPGSGGYQLLHDGAVEAGARWDPCRPIHYVTRPAGAPVNGEQLIAHAFSELSRATGLVFVSDGATEEVPDKARGPVVKGLYGEGWAPVLVTWSDPAEDSALSGDIAGFAGPYPADPDGRGPRYVTGTVTLDAPQLAAAQDPYAYTSILLHELGHLAGFDHVEDPADVMHAHGGRYSAYTPGALRGLRDLGDGPCFS